ncbi:MAG: hypothetical protein ACI9VS_003962 [Candidatus Binatia bacterium]|jgi:uncharacterized protein YbaR (Trm112 family)
MIDKELLDIIRCPETKQKLTPANEKQIADLNARIEADDLKDRGGDAIKDKIDGGLIREDGKFLYLIRDEVPVLLVDEAIPMVATPKS